MLELISRDTLLLHISQTPLCHDNCQAQTDGLEELEAERMEVHFLFYENQFFDVQIHVFGMQIGTYSVYRCFVCIG